MKFRKSSRSSSSEDDKIELQMTPMIDIVFQLLTFFIMTFNIVAQEGDFNIAMPAPGAMPIEIENTALPRKIVLVADDEGNLASISVNGTNLSFGVDDDNIPDFGPLHQLILKAVEDEGGPGSEGAQSLEVELVIDFKLKYKNTISAISAISGEKKGGEITKLIEKLRFAPPKRQP